MAGRIDSSIPKFSIFNYLAAMMNLKKLFRPSPFKIGIAIVITSVIIYRNFGSDKPAFLKSVDNYMTNVMFKCRGKVKPTGSVVIVDIDEESLNKIGQWPWPRNTVAELVNKIHAAGGQGAGV